MVNVGFNSAAILGIFLAVAGAGLYFLRSIRPELARDQDIFFSAVGVLCGGILLTQGWRLDPILLFGQVLLTGSAVFFAYEAIRLRGIATEQAKRNTPIEDYDRPVSPTYRTTQDAELYDYDELEPMEERYENRRLRGTAEPRDRRGDRYEAEVSRPRSRGTSERSSSGERPPRRRTTRRTSSPQEGPVYSGEARLDSEWDEQPLRSSRKTSTRPESSYSETGSRPKSRRSTRGRTSTSSPRDTQTTPTDVDYQPIDSREEDLDNSGNFDY